METRAAAAEDMFKASALTPLTAPTIRKLTALKPRTIAVIHSSSYAGDGARRAECAGGRLRPADGGGDGGGARLTYPRIRAPSGSKSGWVISRAGRRSPRISISNAAPSPIISTGTNPSATDFPM